MSQRSRLLLEAVDYVASAQDGLITASQLSEIGIPGSTLQGRIRSGGPWRRVLPGIYYVMPGFLSPQQRDRAALLFSGPDAMLTGAAGLRRHGLRYHPPGNTVHTLISHARHRKSSGFVIVERTQSLPSHITIGGLPVAPVARAVVDAARRVTVRNDTRAFTLEAVQRGLTTTDDLVEELRHAQRRGTALVREVVSEAQAGVRSAPEAELRQAILQTDLPEPLWNPGILHPNGEFLAQPDGLITVSMVAIEVDSRTHHSEGDDWEDTLERGTDLSNAGLQVVHVIPSRFRRNPQQTLNRIRRAHELGLQSPPPDLQVISCDEFEELRRAWSERNLAESA
jgi:hypothetical protein